MTCIGMPGVSLSSATVSAGAAAALTVQAVSTVVTVAASAVAEVPAVLAGVVERRGQEQLDAEAALREWHMAAAEAVGLNATIRLLARRATGAGVAVELPAPMDLAYRKLAEVAEWTVTARTKVEAARGALASAVMDQEWRRLVADLPVAVVERPSVANGLARYQAMLRERHGPEPDRTAFEDDAVADAVGLLDSDASGADRELMLRAAAHVLAADPSDARTYLSALRRKVREANRRAAGRRRSARWLEALEHPVSRTVTPPAELDWAATVDELYAVLDGHAEPAPELEQRAAAALNWTQAVSRLHYRREALGDALREHGYEVTFLPGDGRTAGLRLRRGDWHDEHTADVWVDAGPDVHVRLLRDVDGSGDDAALRDADRAEELGALLHGVAHELSHRGLGEIDVVRHRMQHRNAVGTGIDDSVAAVRAEPLVRRIGGPSDDSVRRRA